MNNPQISSPLSKNVKTMQNFEEIQLFSLGFSLNLFIALINKQKDNHLSIQ